MVAAVVALAAGLAGFGSAADAAPVAAGETPVVNRAAPPLPKVRTALEPGAVDVDKLNARVKGEAKKKRFEKRDREKYGLVSRAERGHARKFKR
jgi:hypothetical protein